MPLAIALLPVGVDISFFPKMQLLLFLLIAVGVIVAAIYGHKRSAKRRLLLRQFAQSRGLSWEPRESSHIDLRFAQFQCFQRGSNRYGYNNMRGDLGARSVWCFDFHYETRSTDSKGRTRVTHHHSSNVVLDSGRRLKELAIRREGFFDRVAGAFGFDDIDFESAEFSRMFHVKSPDKKWAYDVVSQRTMELLMRAPSFRIELGGTHILVRRDSRFTPSEYDAAMALAANILDGIPADAV